MSKTLEKQSPAMAAFSTDVIPSYSRHRWWRYFCCFGDGGWGSLLLLGLLLTGCTAEHKRHTIHSTTPVHIVGRHAHPSSCDNATWKSYLFDISINGHDAGREARTTFPATGPMGPETVTISHIVTRHQSDSVDLDRFIVQTERFLTHNHRFLRGSMTHIDESSILLSLVGFNGEKWERVEDRRLAVDDPISVYPHPVALTGNELVGFQLNDHLIEIATGTQSYRNQRDFYLPRFDRSVPLTFSKPVSLTYVWNDQPVQAIKVSALRRGGTRVVLDMIITSDGLPLKEYYPALHHMRTLRTAPLDAPTQSTSPTRGLFSDAYLGYAAETTRALYHIVSNEPISPADFAFLAEPENQQLVPKDSHTLELTVTRGAPHGQLPPDDADLQATPYINTDAPDIEAALTYLKTAGASGTIPPHRIDHVIPIIARAKRITDNSEFWNDPRSVARLIGSYVHALLPHKDHTYTMKSATESLRDGVGDCTEHSVLFAAFMRACGIPTRLISGMYLSFGGSWVFHMWAEYYDGNRWHGMDVALGPTMAPAAHYVALAKSASTFADHRDTIALFLDKSYSGLKVNLVEATANGDSLILARPQDRRLFGNDAILFHARTLSRRGSHAQALHYVDSHVDTAGAPLSLELIRAELLFNNGEYAQTLDEIDRLEKKTSLERNTLFLHRLAFSTHLAQQNYAEAKQRLDTLKTALGRDDPLFIWLNSRFEAAARGPMIALATLENGLASYPTDTLLLTAYIDDTGRQASYLSADRVQNAMTLTFDALYHTHYADRRVLKAAARLHYMSGRYNTAEAVVNHAMIMQTADEELIQWQADIDRSCSRR